MHADFVYSEYLISGQAGCSGYRSMIYQIAEDYACADLILRLPGHAPMPAFREVEDVPLVVRHARKSREQVGETICQALVSCRVKPVKDSRDRISVIRS